VILTASMYPYRCSDSLETNYCTDRVQFIRKKEISPIQDKTRLDQTRQKGNTFVMD